MTTIAYKAGVMAADTRAYAGFNTVLGHKTKIRRLGDGTLIGCSTNLVGFGESVLDWFATGGTFEDAPKADEMKFSFIAVKPSGDGFYACDSFRLSGPIHAECFAIGSGEALAHGAMRAGASAKQAVEIAAECDVWTGLPVVTITHEG
jgi:ATP-dependent protease HslVU (ClpYQ) peptidase subunit